jgi:hypothetical protein
MADIIDTIRAAKEEAGEEAYLWLHTSGDCILWPNEEESIDDSGVAAIGRWHLTDAEVDRMLQCGLDDDLC